MRTGIEYTHHLVPVLRKMVEEKMGCEVNSPEQIAHLSQLLVLNEDTIRRIWGFRDSGYKHIRRSTIDILCKYAGYSGWEAFVKANNRSLTADSLEFVDNNAVRAEDLNIGDKVAISWLPDRLCTLLYCGQANWRVLEVCHSHTLHVGDVFSSSIIAVHRPFYLDNVTRDGKNIGGILIAKEYGIQTASLIAASQPDHTPN